MREHLLSLLFLVMVPVAAISAEELDRLKAIAISVEKTTKIEIERLDSVIRKATASLIRTKRGAINPRIRGTSLSGDSIVFQSAAIKATAVKEAEDNLKTFQERQKKLKSGEAFAFGSLVLPAKLNAFGCLQSEGKVVQVIDKDSLILKAYYTEQSTLAFTESILMVKGVSTEGVTDNSAIKLPMPFEVVGTETYRTVNGTNTVFVITPFDEAKIVKFLKQKD
jgi:hypothetical protein